jgi:uncharacterized protein (TIGR02145 family)
MCFNLGAQNGITIQQQKDYPIAAYTNSNALHSYISGEENIFGNLFQWGRIADGHEFNNPATNSTNFSGMTATEQMTGNRCSANDIQRPGYQVKQSSAWYGKFIHGTAMENNNNNWSLAPQTDADQLWHASAAPNDPCTHYKTDGSYQDFWHTGTNYTSAGIEACESSETSWRLPTQEEWAAIYIGTLNTASPSIATANSWRWRAGTSTAYNRGYEIQPDGETTTLFLPAAGYRSHNDGRLWNAGVAGDYWSVTILNQTAYHMVFESTWVSLGTAYYRGRGSSLRCIKAS